MNRRKLLILAGAALAPIFSHAQEGWPRGPVRLIVPFPPGGGSDATSRLVAEGLSAQEKWTVVVENRAGAAGNIGLDAVAKSKPDGHTLGVGQLSNLVINPLLMPKMPYDSRKDFTFIGQISAQPVVLVVKDDSPFKTLADVLKAARDKPGTLGVAQAGNGTVGHLAGELLARRAGVSVLQVPYKGAGQAMTDLLGGQVPLYFGGSVSVLPQVQGGKIRALAVTSRERLAALPNVPTVAEQGYPDFEVAAWLGLVGPAGLPRPLVQRINQALVELLERSDIKSKILAEGSVPAKGSADLFARKVGAEYERWGVLIKQAGITE